MVHSVQIDHSDISENSNAMPYAMCAMRFASSIEYRESRDIEYPVSSTEFGIVYFVDSLTSEIGMQAGGYPA